MAKHYNPNRAKDGKFTTGPKTAPTPNPHQNPTPTSVAESPHPDVLAYMSALPKKKYHNEVRSRIAYHLNHDGELTLTIGKVNKQGRIKIENSAYNHLTNPTETPYSSTDVATWSAAARAKNIREPLIKRLYEDTTPTERQQAQQRLKKLYEDTPEEYNEGIASIYAAVAWKNGDTTTFNTVATTLNQQHPNNTLGQFFENAKKNKTTNTTYSDIIGKFSIDRLRGN